MMSQQESNRYVVLYFQVHQPKRLRPFSFFDIGMGRDYFDDDANREIMRRVANVCYLPTNFLLLKLIRKYPQIRIAFSISGVALREMERSTPAVIETFRMLAATGSVEFLSETYYHSLAALISPDEFERQVNMHRKKIHDLFGMNTTIFRNTELIYSDEIGSLVAGMGFKGMIADGHEVLLGQRSAHHLYEHPSGNGLNLFFRNYALSDDIAFRFNQQDWIHWPLTPKKFMSWLEAIPEKENLITLSLDYETFGEHQKENTGVFRFLNGLISSLAVHKVLRMVSPSEAISLVSPKDIVRVASPASWADQERDLSAWLGNELQKDAFQTLRKLEAKVKTLNNPVVLNTWRHLQTSDHLYYMSTKSGADGRVHDYFSPYPSPYEAFMNFMNVLNDFSLLIEEMAPVSNAEVLESTLA
jgi:alpha-amylase